MNRYALKIEYAGTAFHGWQMQPGLDTVQGALNFVLKKLDPSSDGVVGAGRTDAGVHAVGQVAHLDLRKTWNSSELQQAINFYLKPKLIAITAAEKVNNNLNARFSAMKRHYLYKIMNRKPPLTFKKNK